MTRTTALILGLVVSITATASQTDFYFSDIAGEIPLQQLLKGEVGQVLDSSCQFPVEEQSRIEPYCPIPPKQKNGNNCYPGVIPGLDRHAAGYEEYITAEILKAARQTERFSVGGVSPMLLFSIMAKESFFNPMAYNQWKDMGIAQFQLGTANSTLSYMRSIGIEVPSEATDRVPPNCRRNKYSDPLTSACFRSIKENCTKAAYMNSLFCPNFAVRLMAFHLLQVQEREVVVWADNERFSMVPILVPTEDHEAGLRHVLSVYNRGFRIYNSAYQEYLTDQNWTPASVYGHLWSQPRHAPAGSDPFAGGTLSGHYINRCYVWAIGGLCGGVKGSIFQQFRSRLCDGRSGQSEQRLSEDSYRYFVQREFDQAIAALHREMALGPQMSRRQLARRVRLALNILEANGGTSRDEIIELFSYGLQKTENDKNLSLLLAAYKRALREIPLDMEAAFRFYDELKDGGFVDSLEKNVERLAFFRMLQITGWRQWADTRETDRLPWLYLSGAAGFHYFGSGQEDLKEYLEICANSEMRNHQACRYTSQAQKLTGFEFLGQREKWFRPEPDEEPAAF